MSAGPCACVRPNSTPWASASLCGERSPGQVGQEQRRALPRFGAERGGCGEQRRLVAEAEAARGPAHRAGGRQHHRHLVPAARQRMAEGVHRSLGAGLEALAADEDHAGGAEGDEALSGFHQPHADGAGRVVAAAAGDGHAGRHAPALRQLGLELPGQRRCPRPAAASAHATGRRRPAVRRTSRARPRPATACPRRPTCRSRTRRSA